MSENQTVEAEAVELTYNQRAKNLIMEVPDEDFSYIYKEAVTNYTDVLREKDWEEIDSLTLMQGCAEVHSQFFAEYILQKLFGEEDAEQILEGFHSTAFNFEHLQEILNELDAGGTIDQFLEDEDGEDEDEDDEE